MKNFTKQNFKTNPLWIRLLIMTFMLLAGVIEIYGTTVYFVNKPKWSQVNVHNWNGGTGTTWPGTKATKETYQVEGCDVYRCDIGNNKNFIFSNNGSNQTGDLHIDNGTWYYDGVLYHSKGAIEERHSNHTSITTFSIANTDVIYFDASNTGWTSCYMYIGHSSYSKRFAMTRVSGTKNLWKGTSFGAWNDARAWYFSSEDWDDIKDGKGDCVLCKACYHNDNTYLMPYKSDFTTNNIYKASSNNQEYATAECSSKAWSWSSTKTAYTNYTVTLDIVGAGSVTVLNYDNGKVFDAKKVDATSSVGYKTFIKSITATADAGNKVKSIKIGSSDFNQTNGYEVTGNVTITVTFEPSCTAPAKPTIKINGETGSVNTCGEDGTLTIDANHVAESYKLFTKSGSNYTEKGTISDKTIQVTTTGTYVVRAYNGECMTESDPITFTKNTKPTITASQSTPASQTICQGATATLSVNESMTSYLWSTEATTQSISVGEAGTYTVTATDANGCESNQLSFNVTVNALPIAPTGLGSATICKGETVNLPPVTGSWYESNSIANPLAETTVSPSETTSYFATSKSNNCESSSRTEYVVTVKPKVAIAWNQASENMLVNNTQNVSTTLTGTGNVVYTSSDNTIIKVEGNKLTALKTGTATITATATGTNDYCGTATVTKEITVTCVTVNAPNVTASDICSGGTATLTLNNRQDGVTYKLNSTSGTAIFGSSTTYTTPALDGNTTYKIYASHANACTNNIEGSVTVYVVSAPQTPSLSTNRYMLNTTNTTATLTIGNYVSGVTYTLYKGENSTEKTTTGTTFTVTEGGIYKVKGTNTNNPSACKDTEFSNEVTINVCPTPATPSLSSTAVTACDGTCTAQGYIIIGNMGDYKDDTYTFELGNSVVTPDANGRLGINSTAYTQYTVTVTNSCGNSNNAQVDIAINDNKPTITGNNSFQPGGSTTLTSDKGASTTWEALDGGDITGSNPGTSIVFTAEENGTYPVQATYNGCSTIVEIKVQDDLYVWVRRPIKKETAYDQFYHEDQNSEQGGDLFYKEFASLHDDYKQYNQGGKAAEQTCTDKDGYTWYGFVVSKEAIENNYYFTVHAPNDGGKQGDAAKYNGFYTHTYATQLVDMDADLYFVMDETPSNVSRGWHINTPVVVRASGDASFNSNNFADFVPLYVKDANICGKEVVSFEWQKSASQNGTYSTYKSGKGINNIRTREAGWYRCVVTYGDGKGTATSNAIQVTNTTSGTPTALADFSSKLPVIMVNTNGVGFPSDKNLATKNTNCASGKRYPSLYADDLKEKVTVDVIIKKGNEILYDRKARMNYRGSSSLNFKKKSYAFCSAQDSCVFDKGRHDYVKTKKEKMLNLLGDENYKTSDKDWVLYAATPDPSMMRNRLVFDLYQQMRPEDWGVHSTYVELIVDGEYRGVYVFMDKITANEGRVNITNSDGFIVKFDKTDVVDRVENKDGDQKTFATTRTGTKENSNGIESYGACIDQRFEIEYPEKEDIEDAGGNWEAFYQNVQARFEAFETALANKKYEEVREIIDYDSWADWFILSEFIKNQDGFRASNIFIYNGGKIMATPLWDQELSLDNRTRIAHGSDSENGLLSTTSSVYTDAFPAPFWFTNKGTDVNNLTGGLLNDPCFVALVKSKWDEYQADALSASNISELVGKYHGELDDAIRSREANKWPYTEAARGKTTDGDYMGYYAEGDPNHYSYNASKNAITSYATKRSTSLDANSGLGKAINNLNGETLIFNIKPATVETSPWQQSVISVNAPTGYEYILDYSALTAVGAEVKQNGNTYTIKVPRPNTWETAGNGAEKKVTYQISATIDAEGDNACGAQIENTATATINVNDVTEDCDPPIVKP